MLVQTYRATTGGTQARNRTVSAPNGHSRHQPGLMDSPTLARVERATLRHEPGTNREGRTVNTQSLLYGKESTHALKRGLLWQQRDKLFSRWKERYFILTRDYLHCFRRASGADRISEMGQFLFKVKLVDVDRVDWENKKTYSAVALVIGRDAKIYLRASDGLEDWFELLEECTATSKERRRALRHSQQTTNDRSNWSTNGDVIVKPEVMLRRKKDDDWDRTTLIDNRLSRVLKAAGKKKRKWYLTKPLLTDIDIGAYEDTPSVTSYRVGRDVTRVHGHCDSFRSVRGRGNRYGAGLTNVPPVQFQCVQFRERSYSDIQHGERKPWIVDN